MSDRLSVVVSSDVDGVVPFVIVAEMVGNTEKLRLVVSDSDLVLDRSSVAEDEAKRC